MRLLTTRVICNELHTQELEVPPWETEVLEAVHGSGNVTIIGEREDERPLPSPPDEYARLERRYGADREEGGLPFVARVYGQMGAGVRALAERMKAGQSEQADQEAPGEPGPLRGDVDLPNLEDFNAPEALKLIERIEDIEYLTAVAAERGGDPRKSVRQAADERLGALGQEQAAKQPAPQESAATG